jgi:hypothetical protein
MAVPIMFVSTIQKPVTVHVLYGELTLGQGAAHPFRSIAYLATSAFH